MTKFFAKRHILTLSLLLSSLLAIAACGSGGAGGTSSSHAGSTTKGGSSAPAGNGGYGKATVHISQPYTDDLTNGACLYDSKIGTLTFILYSGSVTKYHFTFTIGPDPNGIGDNSENNPRYHGADTYSNVTISAYDPNHKSQNFDWSGTLIMNSDTETGSFTVTDPGAQVTGVGTFDCGGPIKP